MPAVFVSHCVRAGGGGGLNLRGSAAFRREILKLLGLFWFLKAGGGGGGNCSGCSQTYFSLAYLWKKFQSMSKNVSWELGKV